MFLVQKLNFKWDEVHEMAEQLEHIQSDELFKRMDKFLGFPKFDPHGEPIPDVNGKLQSRNALLLSQLKKGKTCVMVGVIEHSPDLLRYLDKIGFGLGNEIRTDEIVDYLYWRNEEKTGRSFFIRGTCQH